MTIEKMISVTPFVGVWIETYKKFYAYYKAKYVTPFVGVWIETSYCLRFTAMRLGHTLRGCVD